MKYRYRFCGSCGAMFLATSDSEACSGCGAGPNQRHNTYAPPSKLTNRLIFAALVPLFLVSAALTFLFSDT